MRLIGLLSFFDEEPETITRAIEGAVGVGIDYLIAADGPYDLFESDKQSSGFECIKAVHEAVANAMIPDHGLQGMSLLPKSWSGNEVEKRNFMLDYAFECVVQTSDDWFLVFDADHFWQESDYDLKRQLASTTCDFAEASFADGRLPDGEPSWYEARLLMRAVPGMRYDGAHWRIRLLDGRTSPTLRAGAADTDAPALDLREMFRVWHGVHERDQERRELQRGYYRRRDSTGVEA